MNTKNFNGFVSEEQYEMVKEMVESIVENNKDFPYDTFAIYGGDGYIEVVIDDYSLMLYSGSGCEISIDTNKHSVRIDWDIVDIAAELANAMRNGDFDFVFDPEGMEN